MIMPGQLAAEERDGEEIEMKPYIYKVDGTITVFLSLILILILSLLLTVIEGARIATARVFAERALITSMDSILAEYYGPLWEEYHLFGYYPGEGNHSEGIERLEASITENMSYTFYPDKGLEEEFSEKSTELYDISIEDIRISNEAALTDYEGELLVQEAVQYMKYKAVGNGFEVLLDKLSLLETPRQVSYVMEDKLRVEDELAEIDRGILELMELLDGIVTDSHGIEIDSNSNPRTTDYFVKKICFEAVTKDAVGINNGRLFVLLQNNYVNPQATIDLINNDLNRINQVREQRASLMEETSSHESELVQVESQLAEVQQIKEKSRADKDKIKDLKGTVAEIKKDISEISIQIDEQSQLFLQLESEIHVYQEELMLLIDKVYSKLEESGTVIAGILSMVEDVAPMVDEYEELLSSQKDFVDQTVYTGLEEGLAQMKSYISAEGAGYDFEGMKLIIENDKVALKSARIALIHADELISQGGYDLAGDEFRSAGTYLHNYRIEGLELDYSTLILNQDKQKAPLEEIRSLLKDGLTGLVLDEDTISKDEVSSLYALPSQVAEIGEDRTDCLAELSLFLQNSITGQGRTGISELFTGFGDQTQLLNQVKNGVEELTQYFLYQEYLREHFGSYQSDSRLNNSRKPAVLEYEQEYLIVGKASDHENISSVISRIILLRTLFDFASILSNKTIQSEARILATSLVGFTGMPMLIGLTQILILLLWSVAEALLDTCALMMGKEVPILKKNIMMQLPELFLINQEFLTTKASGIETTKELSFSYQDYLRVFMIMTGQRNLTYRSMDLIQENIKLRYQVENFGLARCLFGFDAEAEYVILDKFMAIPLIKEYIGGDARNFYQQTKITYSY